MLADGSDIMKPDIAAPGVAILAATQNAPGETPTFGILSGTSMASPHIAGLAALYLGERPNAKPAEIKSAMMTTAYDTVNADGSPNTDPFQQGAGQVDPKRYFNPGLLYLNDVADWTAYLEGKGLADFPGSSRSTAATSTSRRSRSGRWRARRPSPARSRRPRRAPSRHPSICRA